VSIFVTASWSDWIQAIRLRTLPLAASCILTGFAVGYASESGPVVIMVLTLLTAFLLQVLSNLANDYGDSVHGADNANRVGPARAVQSGRIAASQMKAAVGITATLALGSGLLLLWLAFGVAGKWRELFFLLIFGLFAILAAYAYTAGKRPYGYRGWGDVFVLLFFGAVGVGGSYFLVTHELGTSIVLPAIWVGLQSTAVLNLNNLRDHVNDRATGKMTLVVRMGFVSGKRYHTALIAAAGVAMLVESVLSTNLVLGAMCGAWAVFSFFHLRRVWRCQTPAAIDPELKRVALMTFLLSVVFFVSQVI